jgi:acyl-CoA hydrolase
MKSFDLIQSGHRLFIQGGVATPNVLLKHLVEQAPRLSNVELIHLHTVHPAEYAKPKYKGIFRVVNLFVGANMRSLIDFDRVDYLPCFLSEIPQLFRSGIRRPNGALIHVSSPDRRGFCSLGTSVDVTKAAIETADYVIAQVNPQMPRTHGQSLIHISEIDELIHINESLPEAPSKPQTDIERKIGQNVASLIADRSTLQMGVGNIPDAVLAALTNHKDLGIHTEMWSDGALPLLKSGVITNRYKKVHPGKTVSGFVTGTLALYDFINDNPDIFLLDISFVNNPRIIASNPKAVAINSAVEIDLTGQVCADSVGHHIISGVGGQIDFMRGSALSEGGKPIIAMTSRTPKKISKIVSSLKSGAGVVTTRAHVHYVVTEYGIADLFGKSLGERAKALIGIAHPDDRESLEKTWTKEYRSK